MIDKDFQEKMGESVLEVFSTMYFLPVILLDKVPEREEWNLESRYIAAKISFIGPKSSNIRFFFPESLARNIAESFLGADSAELSPSQAVDTMREAANMMIGCFLGKVDPDGACKLGIPSAECMDDFSPDKIDSGSDLFVFRSDYGFLWLACSD